MVLKKKHFLVITSVIFSILFGTFGFAAIIQPTTTVFKHLIIPNEDAIKWFGMSIVVFLIPFLEGMSISGIGFKFMNEIQKTNEKIDNLAFVIKSQKTQSR